MKLSFLDAMDTVNHGYFVESDCALYFKKGGIFYYTTINDDFCAPVEEFVLGEISGKWRLLTAKDENKINHIMKFFKPNREV